MIIPYRARRSLGRFVTAVLSLALLAVLVLLLWLLWLNRYVVYSRDGAKLDFSLPVQYAPGVLPVEPEPGATVTVHNKQEEEVPPEEISHALTQFIGCSVTLDSLKEDFDGVRARLEALPEGSTVLLELKDVRSRVYYTSEHADESSGFDTVRMDALIRQLQDAGHYVIAQIPAFQEYDYILDNQAQRVPYGLRKVGGSGSLWLDPEGPCYWLNPASDGTLTYLIQLVTELRSLGFDEVVFSDFRIPETDQIIFDGDRLATLNETAEILVKTCATDTFCVSFIRSAADLTLPEGRTRLYLTGIAAADADEQAAASGLADPKAQVVFITELSDTRYEAFSVLKPLDTAH